MVRFKKFVNVTGLIVFTISMLVYILSVERSGSLWDCGEFILGAYKLQVVHPPGAPLFLMTGRLFASLGDLFSSNPEHIAFAVNLMSGLFSALSAMMIGWIAMILGKLSMVGRKTELTEAQLYTLGGAGLAAGLSTAFCTSIWFSAVEGEVYAMSTFFSVLTFWAMVKWYNLKDTPNNDKWVVFAIYAAGLSLGVHLLSLLTFPVLAVLYYFKKYKDTTALGVLASFAAGVALLVFVQKVIIVGLPIIWSQFEVLMVNNFGAPVHSGLLPTGICIAAVLIFVLRYAHKNNNAMLQTITVSIALLVISFMSMGTVVIRANANPPVNMNEPSNVMRLIPYLNREQYGERALFKGPDFEAKAVSYDRKKRYSLVGDQYVLNDEKVTPVYANKDKQLFPRMSDGSQGRPGLYRQWIKKTKGKINLFDNIEYFRKYQAGWMYFRYFMWNFSGRQNGSQGYYKWDPADGHWISGIGPLDAYRTHNLSEMPDRMRNHQARNRYFFLPLIFGMLGLLFHYRKRKKEFYALLGLFFITGIGIILYTNQPPNEPRERDYVLVGSFFTYCVWIGLGVLAMRDILGHWIKGKDKLVAIAASAIVLTAPAIMLVQNWDDHSRAHHKAARDYASNFLNSLQENAILFTYGDNDTYPLWYAQEVEGIRTDVRVINLSLIAVDWYINQMRRKVNDSPAISFTIPEKAYLGGDRNQIFYPYADNQKDPGMNVFDALKFLGENHPKTVNGYAMKTFLKSRKLSIPIDQAYVDGANMFSPGNDQGLVNSIPINLGNKSYITKDEIAIMDIVASNVNKRPVYFSVTCQPKKMLGLKDYSQLEGLALRIVPKRTPTKQNLIYFYGDIDTEKMYDNVVNKWRWGNFDTKRLYATSSLNATLQAQKLTMSRLVRELTLEGKRQKAADVAAEYFTAFPHMNFKYDSYVVPFIEAFINNGNVDEAKKHIGILSSELQEYMEFYSSLDPDDLQSGFRDDYRFDLRAVSEALQLARGTNDQAFAEEMNGLIGRYQSTNLLRG